MQTEIKRLIESAATEKLRQLLTSHPELANEGLSYSVDHPEKAHPLHRLCDAVFEKKISDAQAVDVARILLECGANVNGIEIPDGKDSPLVAASSLFADEVAILLIDRGADIHHAGCHGGTPIHWASWCGRDRLVAKLISAGANLDRRCRSFQATPLGWALHGFRFNDNAHAQNQLACARLLLEAGADKNIPNSEGTRPVEFLDESHVDFLKLFDRF